MAQRTLDNCKYVTKYGKPNQYDGMCEGFAQSEYDDEPCEACKQCKLHYINQEEDNEGQTISRIEFNQMAHAGFLSFAVGKAEIKKAFKDETGFNLDSLAVRSGLDVMIDKATGFEQELVYRFIVWVTDTMWDECENNDQIEVYKKAKEFLKSKGKL